MQSMKPGCRLVRGVQRALARSLSGPRLRIDLESGAGRSMPGCSGSILRTGLAVPKMLSLAPGKIRQLRCLWERKNRFGEVFLSELRYPT